MSNYVTNGYIVQHLTKAADEPKHESHAEAGYLLTKFRAMEATFFEEIHPLVDVGLAVSETQLANGADPNIYTVHGCRHVSDLIKSLDKLARSIEENTASRLTALESYILLCAAHIHDAANVGMRRGHPSRSNEILRQHKSLFSSPIEIQQIYQVASVHGGEHAQFGKDTFRSLDADNHDPPRLPLLASLLRLGDELSENPGRVPEIVAQSHAHSEMSKLAYAYARSFAKFELRHNTLFIVYNVYSNERSLRVHNPGGDETFFDFLESKVDVIEREARYCTQYGRPLLDISQLSVTVHMYEGELASPLRDSIKFDLYLAHGYPGGMAPLCKRSPQLSEKRINRLSECLYQAPVNDDTHEVEAMGKSS